MAAEGTVSLARLYQSLDAGPAENVLAGQQHVGLVPAAASTGNLFQETLDLQLQPRLSLAALAPQLALRLLQAFLVLQLEFVGLFKLLFERLFVMLQQLVLFLELGPQTFDFSEECALSFPRFQFFYLYEVIQSGSLISKVVIEGNVSFEGVNDVLQILPLAALLAVFEKHFGVGAAQPELSGNQTAPYLVKLILQLIHCTLVFLKLPLYYLPGLPVAQHHLLVAHLLPYCLVLLAKLAKQPHVSLPMPFRLLGLHSFEPQEVYRVWAVQPITDYSVDMANHSSFIYDVLGQVLADSQDCAFAIIVGFGMLFYFVFQFVQVVCELFDSLLNGVQLEAELGFHDPILALKFALRKRKLIDKLNYLLFPLFFYGLEMGLQVPLL